MPSRREVDASEVRGPRVLSLAGTDIFQFESLRGPLRHRMFGRIASVPDLRIGESVSGFIVFYVPIASEIPTRSSQREVRAGERCTQKSRVVGGCLLLADPRERDSLVVTYSYSCDSGISVTPVSAAPGGSANTAG